MSEWFSRRTFGIGSGWPISWQGWVVSLIYAVIIGAALLLLGNRQWLVAAVIVPATLLFVLIVARTTRGGVRWRWGDDQ